ncbi:MAG: phosphoribosyl-AMP cyclohydrolase [Candidatus Thorarchaeota archaeon]
MIKYSSEEIDEFIKLLDFSKIKGGLIPIITQDYRTSEVLMLAFANEDAIRKTLETGFSHYYSRSRKTLWKKGETSGYVQEIQHIITDCDNDSILFKVKQIGAACHKGYDTCFYNEFKDGKLKIIGKKVFNPDEVYKK